MDMPHLPEVPHIPKLSPTQIFLIIFIFLLITIPSTTFLLSLRFRAAQDTKKTNKNNGPVTSLKEVPKDSPLKGLTDAAKDKTDSDSPNSSPTSELKLFPTMNFKIKIEGRPDGKHGAKLFVGLAADEATSSPKYLLSFSVNVPDTGEYQGLSLAGLDANSYYTAYLKGPAQIATSSSFMVKPTVNDLSIDGPLNLITGDLNEDNVVNEADLTVSKNSLGLSPGNSKWNANADFNLDNIVNNYDLSLIRKNNGKIGASGVWYSKPSVATSSGGLNQNVGSPGDGYWLWVPKF